MSENEGFFAAGAVVGMILTLVLGWIIFIAIEEAYPNYKIQKHRVSFDKEYLVKNKLAKYDTATGKFLILIDDN